MIAKLTVKKLVEFNRLTEKRRLTFINHLKTPTAPKPGDRGGDYWVSALSALATSFKLNDNTIVTKRIEPLANKYQSESKPLTKAQFKKNLEILHNYKDFDFATLRPHGDLGFPKKSNEYLNINNTPLQVLPQHIFTYDVNGEPTIGAIWFVAWVDKFVLSELGMYCESMFKYLTQLHSNHFKIDPNYCLTVDALSMSTVSYENILAGAIPSLLEPSIDSLRKYV